MLVALRQESNKRHLVHALVQSSIDEGAEVRTGGRAPDHPGFYYEPTVLTGVNQNMRVVREEIFGPVLVAQPFHDLDEAIELANDSEYRLGASIFTRDIDSAQKYSRRINAGSVWTNVHNILDVGVPFGGFKHSGLGTDLGKESVLAHTRLKANFLSIQNS